MKQKWSVLVTVGIVCALASSSALAADPAVTCEAGKLKIAGKYGACRLSAESKGVKKGVDPDYSKCELRFSDRWQKSETKAGAGICPSEGDEAAIQDFLDACDASVAEALAGGALPPDPALCDDALVACEGDLATCQSATCGNGVLEAGEDCEVDWADGTTFDTESDCAGEGFADGILACGAGCVYDTSGCRSQVCGDGIVDDPEQCDDGNLVDGDGCDSACGIGAPPTATGSSVSIIEDSPSATFSMSGTSGTGEACGAKAGCTFAVTGCTEGVACTLRAARNVQLPFGYFDADQNAVSLNYDAETGSFSITPVANFYGTVDFTFTTSENGQTSAEATVTIDVTEVQDVIVTTIFGPYVKAYDNYVGGVALVPDMRTGKAGYTGPEFSATGTPNGHGYALMIGAPGADGSRSFKDWRTGSGHWGPRSSDAVLIINDANPLGKPGCLDATPTETGPCTFESGDACVRRTHNIFNTNTLGVCNTNAAAQLHIEATAKVFGKESNDEPNWNAHYKMYMTGVSGTGIQQIWVYMDHTFPGLDAPVELKFVKAPTSP